MTNVTETNVTETNTTETNTTETNTTETTTVLFFGKLSDDLGQRSISLAQQTNVSINDIVDAITSSHGDAIGSMLSQPEVLAAVDKTIENNRNKTFRVISEIAFFPPVTGG